MRNEGGGSGGSDMRVFLTGGTGLIGSHVAEQLRDRGDDVVALVRPTSDTRHLEGLGCELVVGDIMDPTRALAEMMTGSDALVHSAAKVFESGSRDEFLRRNLEGTEAVLSAAARVCPRVVHLSSIAVYAGLPMDRPLTEERWTEADPDRQLAYPASKHLSERAAWRVHDTGGIRLTTVRPSVVYGERDRAAAPIMRRYATLPLVPLIAGGSLRLPLVYAGNVARGILAALDRPDSVGRAYNLALDEPVTARELVGMINRELGRRHWTLPVPAAVARRFGEAAHFLTRVLPFRGPGGLRRAVRTLTTQNPYDSTRARLELGWTNLTGHDEAVRRTVRWMMEKNGDEVEK